jgi:hypothetical protein
MKADKRREIADRAALVAVDRFEAYLEECEMSVFPEELLAIQHDIEEDLYRELARA